MTNVDVSIVIPVLNGLATLPAVLDGIARQERQPRDIIAIDSGSTDASVACLERAGAEVIRIPPGSFNHGLSRNAAVSRARGRLIVLLVQDAIPLGPRWLEALTAPFERDPQLAGTFARQVPVDGATALTCWSLERWVAAGEQARLVGPLTRDVFGRMSPAERHDACAFDDVCACIRRAAWERHPFAQVSIAEDLEWARDVLLDGWKIAFVPDARVRHSHDRGVRYEYERTRAVHARLAELFGLSTVPSLPALGASIARTLPRHLRVATADRNASSLATAAALAIAWPAGQYLGARDARRGILRT